MTHEREVLVQAHRLANLLASSWRLTSRVNFNSRELNTHEESGALTALTATSLSQRQEMRVPLSAQLCQEESEARGQTLGRCARHNQTRRFRGHFICIRVFAAAAGNQSLLETRERRVAEITKSQEKASH